MIRTTLLKAATGLVAVSLAACTQPAPTEPEVISRTASGLTLTERDAACLREAIYHESAANSLDGGRAVAHVILNRTVDPRFPNSVCGVIAEGQDRGRCQFSYRCDGRPENFADLKKLAGANKATEVVLANPEDDPTSGALFFHAQFMAPGWFATLKRTIVAGGNIFYR
ncbi:cell wall hydrolase [Oceanibium sediminis]|uniref:cell wall hydrolase n=1 Tax=Oceanibium sediminis TaxID=2026339 RepID=UPI0013007E9A|nr:cell wall hydrolase [Oceanibium sediminis]